MGFRWHFVGPPLSETLNFLYEWDGRIPYGRDAVFPMPAIGLKFNFGDPLRVADRADAPMASLNEESWCVGLWNRHHIVEWPDRPKFLGVSVKPEGGHAFLGLPLSELHNRVVPLDAIWGRFASEVSDRLREAKSAEQRFAIMEATLLSRLADGRPAPAIVGQVAKTIACHHGAIRIGKLCDDAGVSRKHLITLFKRYVGCTPKEFSRLHRFSHALRGIDLTKPVDWTAVAHDHDYFDQSHFYRDFEDYTGLTPSSYLALRRSHNPADHATILGHSPAG